MGRSTLDNSKVIQVIITDADGDPAGITVDTTGLATDAGQDEIVAAIEAISIPAPVGVALEVTQEEVAANTASLAGVSFADPTTGAAVAVASSASAVTILAANTARKGASVYNDSTQVLYLILSNTTPTSSVYTVKMVAGSYFEVPFGYNGIIKGIWVSANGNAIVTELT